MRCKNESVVVLASGTFDLVHYAHIRYLEEAKKTGGDNAYLIVVVARDKTVEQSKGKRPVIPEEQRRAVVEALKPVDEAILGYESVSFEDTIEILTPNIIALGYDQSVLEKTLNEVIREKGLVTKIIKIRRFGLSDLDSSSKIKIKIMKELK
jgi:FAD synthetase